MGLWTQFGHGRYRSHYSLDLKPIKAAKMVEGGMKCIKYVLFLFNLIFFIAGLALIIAGAVVLTKLGDYIEFMGGSASGLAILVIVVGCIIFIIGFFGCCGAYKENYCMVMTFAFLLLIIFVLEIAAGIAAYVARDKVSDIIQEEMNDSISKYNEPEFKQAWDVMQSDLECCGITASSDWNGNIPGSCCINDDGADPPTCTSDAANLYTDGCFDSLTAWAEDNILIIGGVGIGLAFIQIVGIILSCCLAQSIRQEYQQV